MYKTDAMDTSQPSGKAPQLAGPSGIANRSRKVEDGSINFWVIGDSHLQEGHHFTYTYALARAEGKTDPRFGPLKRKTDWEDEDQGFYLDEEYKGRVLGLVEGCRNKATAILISIGTDDAGMIWSEATADEVVRRLKDIMNKVQETPGVVLYVLEPIPCNEGISWLRDKMDQQLKEECFKYEKVRYVKLTYGNKPLLPKTYQADLWYDQKHLNELGAGKVVDGLFRAQRMTRSEFFLVDPEVRTQKRPENKEKRKPGPETVKGDAVPTWCNMPKDSSKK